MIVLETARLVLRHLSTDDAAFILELLNEPAFIRNIGDRGVHSLDDARLYITEGPLASYERFGFGLYGVELKEAGQLIGICGLVKREGLHDVDIGFALLEAFWSKGYATEAAAGVKAHARDAVGLERIVGVAVPGNRASIRVLEKIGLGFENLVRLADDEPLLRLYGCDL